MIDQKMLMIGGDSGGWGDKSPHPLEIGIVLLSLGRELFSNFSDWLFVLGHSSLALHFQYMLLAAPIL